jgi:hypothetical protein
VKKVILGLTLLSVAFPLLASAHYGHLQNDNGQQNSYGHHQNDGGSHRGSGNNSGSNSGGSTTGSGPGSTPTAPITPPAAPPVLTPPTDPVTTPPVINGEIILSNVYTTGYANADNTPAGSDETDLGGIQGVTGGTGAYTDPMTVAVGHSIIGGVDIPDYAYGTMFYVPNTRKYYEAEDTCGDGNNVPELERSAVKTALPDILSPETGRDVALSGAAGRGGARRARWNIFVSAPNIRDDIPSGQND